MIDLTTARARRLSTVQEILEACDDGHVDIDLMAEVLAEGLEALGPEPDRPQPPDEMERNVMCALSTVVGALRNLTWYLAEQRQPGRARRMIEELPQRMKRQVEEVFMPRVAMMARDDAARLQLDALRWAYVIWSPAEQLAMFRILELAADGKYIPVEERQRAREFLDRYRNSMPMGKRATGGNEP